MVAKYSKEAMSARLVEAKAERAKLDIKLKPLQDEHDAASRGARKIRDRLVALKPAVAELDQEIATLSRALGATSLAAEPGAAGVKGKP